MRTPLALFFISLGVIAAVWWWLATPVTLARAPIDPAAKLECVSYAPFRNDQTPHDRTLIVSPEQIAEDLAELAKISKCIRTYSIDNGLDKVPELASRVGLKVLLGVWIGRDRAQERSPRQHRDLAGQGSSRRNHGDHRRQRSAAARRDDGVRPSGNHPLGQAARGCSGDLRRRLGILAALPGSRRRCRFRHRSFPALLGGRSGPRRRRGRACGRSSASRWRRPFPARRS